MQLAFIYASALYTVIGGEEGISAAISSSDCILVNLP